MNNLHEPKFSSQSSQNITIKPHIQSARSCLAHNTLQ